MKHTLLSLALILFSLGSVHGQTTLDLELNAIPSLDFSIFEVHLSFDVLPDSMGTGNEMGSGWETYDPQYTFEFLPLGTLTTEYYWEESIAHNHHSIGMAKPLVVDSHFSRGLRSWSTRSLENLAEWENLY